MPDLLPEPGVGRNTHELVWVEGRDAIVFCDGQLSQDVAGMEAGAVRRSFLLEPRGRLRALLWVLRGEERVGLITSAGTADGVSADLDRFRFRVSAELRRDPRPVHTLWGAPATPTGWTDGDGTLVAFLPNGTRMVAATQPPAGRSLDDAAVAAWRVMAGEPIVGRDLDEATIAHETGLVEEAVSFTKGCYLGQELVARIDSRGHPNRMLRRVIGSGTPPRSGAPVRSSDRELGSLGTVAPVGGGWLALALLRREAAPGAEVEVEGGGPATVGSIDRFTPFEHPGTRMPG